MAAADCETEGSLEKGQETNPRTFLEPRLDLRNNGQPGLLIARLSLGPVIMIKNGKTRLFQAGLALVIFLVIAIAIALPAFAIAARVGGKQNPARP